VNSSTVLKDLMFYLFERQKLLDLEELEHKAQIVSLNL
jgi:hypothetical protein